MTVQIHTKPTEETALIKRAISALRRATGVEASPAKSQVITIDGRPFVVCCDSEGGILGVYRVRNNGLLRRVR